VPEHDLGIDEILGATEGDQPDFGRHGRTGADGSVSEPGGGRSGYRVFRKPRSWSR
jgi:hypothetical protein